MPRMTRAALKAQAQTDDYPDLDQQHSPTGKEQEKSSSQAVPLIHEDLPATHESGEINPETDIHTGLHDLAVRQALRDITDENYPQADLNVVEVQSPLSPVKPQTDAPEQAEEQIQVQVQVPEPETQKSTRKPRGKAKGRTKKKTNTPTVVESEEEKVIVEVAQKESSSRVESEDIPGTVEQLAQESQNATQQAENTESTQQSSETIGEVSEPGPAVEGEEGQEDSNQDLFTKTPKFDPTVHITDAEEAGPKEDSFVDSITSRSPSKFGLSLTKEPGVTQSSANSLHALTPLRRTSSTNFEESFEALDSLEDTIEQLTAGFSLVPADEMHSPDSPVKNSRRSVRLDATPSAPKAAAAKTPRTARSSRPQSILRTQDKENTPPMAKSPLKSKTPLKPQPNVTKEATPLKARTPAARQSSPFKDGSLSVKKCRTPSLKTIEVAKKTSVSTGTIAPTKPASPTKVVRPSTVMVNETKKPQPTAKKPISKLTRNPSQRQTSVAPAASKTAEPTSGKPTVSATSDQKRAQSTSMNLSASPAKPKPNTHQRRVTSGGILSTSKPGFVPSKSSKPPTTSTFSLPGEAIAEKLKAQKEAREEHKKQPKLSLAEQKAAKLKADREAREERVRLNQIKAKEAEGEKENKKPQRPVSMSILTISKARAEAAERGRQASKEWAEKMLKKKAMDGGKTGGGSAPAVVDAV